MICQLHLTEEDMFRSAPGNRGGRLPPSRRAGGIQALNPWFKNEVPYPLRLALKLAVFMDLYGCATPQGIVGLRMARRRTSIKSQSRLPGDLRPYKTPKKKELLAKVLPLFRRTPSDDWRLALAALA